MMLNFFDNEKGGFGVASIFWVAVIIVFVILPLSSFGFDHLKLQVVANEITNSVDSAVVESFRHLETPFLTKEEFRADNGLFQYYVEQRLKTSLKLKEDFTPEENSLLDGPFSLNSLTFVDSTGLPYTDPDSGKVYNRPFVEIDFTIRLKPLLYQQTILNALGKEYKEFNSVRKVSLPINN